MNTTPKALRLHIAILGKTNVGKSSLVNNLVNQEVSIVSDTAGTTTDAVEKAMELLPIGPVVFIDTAGIDDTGLLGLKRVSKTKKIIERTDVAIIVCDGNGWDNFEKNLFKDLKKNDIPVLAVVNKNDEKQISEKDLDAIKKHVETPIIISATNDKDILVKLKKELIKVLPDEFVNPPTIVCDLLKKEDICVLVVPIDKESPKGRIILPQVQVIRDLLDHNCQAFVIQDEQVKVALNSLEKKPALVITDSQAFEKISARVPEDIPLTSFSILFARLKGDLKTFVEGANSIATLEDNDKVLIAESCSHHQIDDDIAKVKIPRWINKKTGKNIVFEYCVGHSFPEDLSQYKLIIHCGGCMTNKREILTRIMKAKENNVPITNYGITIAYCTDILDRAIKPFGL